MEKIDSDMKNSLLKALIIILSATYAPKFKGWEGTFKAVDSLIENNYYNVKMNVLNKDGPTLKLMWKIYLDKNKNFKILRCEYRWCKYVGYTKSRVYVCY